MGVDIKNTSGIDNVWASTVLLRNDTLIISHLRRKCYNVCLQSTDGMGYIGHRLFVSLFFFSFFLGEDWGIGG